MGGRASVLVEIVVCFGGVVRQGICESRFFLKPGDMLRDVLRDMRCSAPLILL
jgi:hypothetical protein